MTEITDDPTKVIPLHPARPPLATVSAEIKFIDDLLIVTRLTFRIGDQVWHEHLMHELADDEPEAD